MGFTLRPDVFRKDSSTGKVRIVEQHHYVRLTSEESPPIFLQDGQAFFEGGEKVSEYPHWFQSSLNQVSEDMLRTVGCLHMLKKESSKTETKEPEPTQTSQAKSKKNWFNKEGSDG